MISACAAQSGHSSGTTDVGRIVAQLVRNNQTRADQLQHYQGCRDYTLDYVGFPSNKSAEMLVGVEYNAPAEKRFHVVREKGPKLMVNKVFRELLDTERATMDEEHRKSTALGPDNYEFRFAGTDTFNGRPQYVLEVTPRTHSKYLYQGKVWVDAADYAVSRIQAEPAKNPSIWISHTEIEHEYMKIGEFWLPARNVSVTKVRLGGTATLRIRYQNYVVGKTQRATADACSDITTSESRGGDSR